MRARFIGGSHLSETENDVLLLVSMNNENQTGEKLNAFFRLVRNMNKNRAKKVKILVADYVNLFYVGESSALEQGDKWLRENEKIIQSNTDVIEIIRLKNLIENLGHKFEERLKEVEDLYDVDEEFHILVDNISSVHSSKASMELARKYLLYECAFISLIEDTDLCYPAKNLNEALSFAVKHFGVKLTYRGYHFAREYEETEKNDKKLYKTAQCLLFAMTKNGIHNKEEQVKLFEHFAENFPANLRIKKTN